MSPEALDFLIGAGIGIVAASVGLVLGTVLTVWVLRKLR